jgi:adenylate kinase family enzyme
MSTEVAMNLYRIAIKHGSDQKWEAIVGGVPRGVAYADALRKFREEYPFADVTYIGEETE